MPKHQNEKNSSRESQVCHLTQASQTARDYVHHNVTTGNNGYVHHNVMTGNNGYVHHNVMTGDNGYVHHNVMTGDNG